MGINAEYMGTTSKYYQQNRKPKAYKVHLSRTVSWLLMLTNSQATATSTSGMATSTRHDADWIHQLEKG